MGSEMCIRDRPVTEHVIKSVENLAEEQDIKSLKVTGKNKIPLLLADCIAGVDYEPCDGVGVRPNRVKVNRYRSLIDDR